MSRLTASPFHKPSAFESIARAPPSPPDTLLHHDSSFSTATVARGIENSLLETDVSVARGHDGLPDTESIGMSPAARFRKVSTLAYMNSGLRESRERGISRPSPKSFVIVIPPAAFQHEHGTLGHTLSSGPAHRHGQGLLMPLFPTFYAQVTAIAKEWNFPSTSGICLYLQYTDNGFTTSPRVSDDTWQFLWSHVLDPSAPVSATRPPIVGKLEFDLDMRLARWYSSWLSSAHRDPYDLGASIDGHFRDDSRTTNMEDDIPDDRSVITRISHRPGRHIPKKLSLVDRIDAASLRKGNGRPIPSPPEPTAVPVHALSPIKQLEEPKSALASKVMSWRASAGGQSNLLATNGQISLDPVNMPNSVPLDSPHVEQAQEEVEEEELNLADFQWSISSAGPRSYIEDLDDDESYYLPSIHMDRRAQGSVCLTASVCTSFGPLDDDYLSDISSISRLPSPDIAYRMLEDCPVSPSVCTSCPDFEWPASPAVWSRAPSVDLGERGVFSRPCTPSTATSWGAPLIISSLSCHAPPQIWSWPYYQPWKGPVWNHVWPYIAYREGYNNPAVQESVAPSSTSPFAGYPTFELYPSVYPKNLEGGVYRSQPAAQLTSQFVVVEIGAAYPLLEIYKAQYPFNLTRLYPESRNLSSKTVEVAIAAGYPNFVLYPSTANSLIATTLETRPPVSLVASTSSRAVKVSIARGYPCFELYAAPYPKNLSRIYTPIQKPVYAMFHVEISRPYPYLEIYRTQYPQSLNKIYPSLQGSVNKLVEVDIVAGYPHFQLYPTPSQKSGFGWPYVQVQSTTPLGWPYFQPNTNPSSGNNQVMDSRPSSLKIVSPGSDYPIFNLYPAPYPHNLAHIYRRPLEVVQGMIMITIGRPYPYLEIYPAQYPNNVYRIYPTVQKAEYPFVEVKIAQGYPNFLLYAPPPSVSSLNWPHWTATTSAAVSKFSWPHWQPAPSVPASCTPVLPAATAASPVKVSIVHGYPWFELYPRPFPTNLEHIFPPPPAKALTSRVVEVEIGKGYPQFQIYKPVYPFSSGLYPPVHQLSVSRVDVQIASGYPSLIIYGPPIVHGYPWLELYPRPFPANLDHIFPATPARSVVSRVVNVKVAKGYPQLQIYSPVYPFAYGLYPSVHQLNLCRIEVKIASGYPDLGIYSLPVSVSKFNWPHWRATATRRTHAELHELVFPGGIGAGRKRPLKTHRDLHYEVFPAPTLLQISSSPRSSMTRRMSPLDAPLGPRLPPPSSPLPPPPANLSPLQAPLGPRLISPTRVNKLTLSTGKPLSPIQVPVGPRLMSPVATRLTHIPSPTCDSTLSLRNRFTEQSQPTGAGLSRHASVAGSAPPPVAPGHKKRDSLVFQRVKAFNSIEQPAAQPPLRHARTPSHSRMTSHSRTPSIAEHL
ncbi:hypothetical protein DL96DRAFT_1593257 [Flagelloscypha sp. PMI_526]|nr:hypothetical protein DL96DRAFT_1593257 [Flagelloscypha sp. PMI_526]